MSAQHSRLATSSPSPSSGSVRRTKRTEPRSRWLVRVRRSRYRYRVRVRDEQIPASVFTTTDGNSRFRQALFHDIVGARTQTELLSRHRDPEAFVWLRLYLADLGEQPTPNEPMWWTLRRRDHGDGLRRQPMNYEALRAVFRRVNAALGTNWTMHDLRHTAALRPGGGNARRLSPDPVFSNACMPGASTSPVGEPSGHPIGVGPSGRRS